MYTLYSFIYGYNFGIMPVCRKSPKLNFKNLSIFFDEFLFYVHINSFAFVSGLALGNIHV